MTDANRAYNYMKENNIKLEDLIYEEDSIIYCTCEDCGHIGGADELHCSKCNGETMLNNSKHEESYCNCCGNYIGVLEDCYVNSEKEICLECYDDMTRIATAKISFKDFNFDVSLTNGRHLYESHSSLISKFNRRYFEITSMNEKVYYVFVMAKYSEGLLCLRLNDMKKLKVKFSSIKNIIPLSSIEQARYISVISNYKDIKKDLSVIKNNFKANEKVDMEKMKTLEWAIELVDNMKDNEPIEWYQYKGIGLDDIYKVLYNS